MAETDKTATNKVQCEMTATTSDNSAKKADSSPEDALHLHIVKDGFQKCQENEHELLLDQYLRAFSELNKFFQFLGTVFNFIANDLINKVTILRCFRQGGSGDYYYSIQSMVQYEKDNKIVHNSGSRTLLRLHRALEFIIGFLEALYDASIEEKMGSHAANIYSKTLAKHHGWILSKTVGAVFLLLPTKQVIIDKVCMGDKGLAKVNEEVLPELVKYMKSLYKLTENLYDENDILDLP